MGQISDWSAEKIIAVGVTLALLITVIGADAVAWMNGDMTIASLGKEIVIGLFGYMGRGAVQTIAQNGKAEEAHKIVDAIGTIGSVIKSDKENQKGEN